MARLHYNSLNTGAAGSTVSLTLGSSLTSGATSVTFNAALTYNNGTAVPTITGSDYIPLEILDTNGRLSEIVWLTAYTAAATTGTITRGQEGTTGVAHASGDKIVHGPTVADVPGAIIAYQTYDPGGLATYTATSTTLADVDATNLAVTFTAPISGKVLVRLTATCQITGAGATLDWSLRVGSTDAASIWRVAATANVEARSVPLVLTGLTAGTSYTYKWSYRRTAVSGTNVTIYAGGNAGPATMEVVALP